MLNIKLVIEQVKLSLLLDKEFEPKVDKLHSILDIDIFVKVFIEKLSYSIITGYSVKEVE